jgi:hypothetical protein
MPSRPRTIVFALALAAVPLVAPGTAYASASISCYVSGGAAFKPGVMAAVQ